MDCADSSSPLIAQPLWLAPWKDEPYPLKGNVVEQRIKEKAESKLAAVVPLTLPVFSEFS